MIYKGYAFFFEGKGWTPAAKAAWVQETLDGLDGPPLEVRIGITLTAFADQILEKFPEIQLVLDTRSGVAHDLWFGYA